MNTPKPLFFQDLVALDKDAHRALTLPQQRDSFAFAAQANLIPITVAEVAQALRAYPLVFVTEAGSGPTLVVVTGLQPGRNTFVDTQGQWRAGAYIPAYVRGYPFIAVRASENAEPVLALDPLAQDFKAAGGKPLIQADGQPSEQLKAVMAFQSEYHHLAQRTHGMVKALHDAGVLEDSNLQLQPSDGGQAQQIGGFSVVSEAKLRALAPEPLKKLMDADALGLAYAQLLSMGSLGNLLLPPAPPPQAKPASH
ncbi:MAG: SapC family protein [Burkholderiales bacterium]|nr:SapC family protein [Burkholderiales bacterium]